MKWTSHQYSHMSSESVIADGVKARPKVYLTWYYSTFEYGRKWPSLQLDPKPYQYHGNNTQQPPPEDALEGQSSGHKDEA